MIITKLFKNTIFFYLISRYFIYFLQFLSSLLIAAKLGPYYMGVWGFVLLIINYFAQFHFGIANSLNVLLVHNKDNKEKQKYYISNSLILICYLSLIVILLFIIYLIGGIPLFNKYAINKFVPFICIIVILQYVNLLISNILRVFNKIGYLTLCQSLVVSMNFISVLLFSGKALITFLIAGYVIGNIGILIIGIKTGCIPKIEINKYSIRIQKEILKKGLLLFLYNACFYYIVLSIKGIISQYYAISEFGLFAFSYTLGNSVFMLLDAFSFIVFPKMIDKFSSKDLGIVYQTLRVVRLGYISTSHLLVYISLTIFPLILSLFPQYKESTLSLNLVTLTILMNTSSTGYSTILIAQNKEKISAIISLGSLIINVCIGWYFASILKMNFSFIILATMISYLFFCIGNTYYATKTLGVFHIQEVICNFIPIRLLIPYVAAIVISIMNRESLIWIPLMLYITLNYRDLSEIKKIVQKLILKPDIINV